MISKVVGDGEQRVSTAARTLAIMADIAQASELRVDARDVARKGIAPIKAEYRLDANPVTSNPSEAIATASSAAVPDDDANEDQSKRPRLSKEQKKERTGQNKGRRFTKVADQGVQLCKGFSNGQCNFVDKKTGQPNCKFSHDFKAYFATKPSDIPFPPPGAFTPDPPYVSAPYPSPFTTQLTSTATNAPEEAADPTPAGSLSASVTHEFPPYCPVFQDLGHCPLGWKCRFLSGHVEKVDASIEDNGKTVVDGYRIKGSLLDDGLTEEERLRRERRDEVNWIDKKAMSAIRSGKYEYPTSHAYLHEIEPDKVFSITADTRPGRENAHKPAQKRKITVALTEEEEMAAMNAAPVEEKEAENIPEKEMGDVDLARIRPEEKRRLNWKGGLYLAPLTTVGNLPFRRLCVEYGATITCSEMALTTPLVAGQSDDWALTRRHKSEKMFGVQIAGGFANRVVPAAEVIRREIGAGVDFVDVNLGCPIDLIFNQGAGSALMDAPGRLGKILVGMNRVLGDIPITVKFRTGVSDKKNTAHKLIPRFVNEWGVSAMTLHGRSRQQRYSKLADWEYIKECADEVRRSLEEANLPPVPIFGNGDCFSAQSYYEEMENSGVDGVMVARGALIKPWLFTEIAERREWDISATERLEGLRKYAEYGLTHWGSDTQGVNITRRFLCEALSFQHRYIPIGLLETMPGRMNDRPPAYKGRSELETLLASPFSGDWIKISEMFLGPTDSGFRYQPKHKSNAYGTEEAQG